MTPQYIMRKSLCREPFCASGEDWKRWAEMEIDNLQYAKEYAEPGYDDPRKGVLFANWNYFPRGLDDILERYGYSVEWSDEWAICDDCYKAVRTEPDSWDWKPSYTIENGEFVCKHCHEDENDE